MLGYSRVLEQLDRTSGGCLTAVLDVVLVLALALALTKCIYNYRSKICFRMSENQACSFIRSRAIIEARLRVPYK